MRSDLLARLRRLAETEARPEVVRCLACGAPTHAQKPYCTEHILMMPYAAEVRAGATLGRAELRAEAYRVRDQCRALGIW